MCETQQICKLQYISANKWHDRECETLRDIFIKERNNLKKRKNPQSLHKTQIAASPIINAAESKRQYTIKTPQSHMHVKLKYENPRLFWKTINPRNNQECPVTLDTFYTYFSELCSQSITPTNATHTSTFLQNYTCTVDELDKDISIAMVEYAIKLLKCGKATGYDNVLNECIDECNCMYYCKIV